MRHTFKNILSTFFLLVTLPLVSHAQTNISGVISTNTTWTLGGSPYIIIDTVSISAGVKLTIQPGVIVKFIDNAKLFTNSQINNSSSIIAIGTNTDSITFTSNSLTPTPGSWSGIQLNGGDDSSSIFNYCNFKYASAALFDNQFVLDVLTIKNSTFSNNVIGLKDYGRMMLIDSCNFYYNQWGLFDVSTSIINHCNISHNQIGHECTNYCSLCGNRFTNCNIDSNQIGLTGLMSYTNIYNCRIRNNQYGVIFNHSDYILLKGSQIDSNILCGISIGGGNLSIDSCQIRYNDVGIIDSGGSSPNSITRNKIENNFIGVKLATANDDLHCNKICNNVAYDLKSITTNNINIANNYWCVTDSTSLQTIVFDGNDSLGLGLVNFTPLDTVQCFNCSNILISHTATLANSPQQNASATAYPTNGNPPYTYAWNTVPIQTTQTATGLGVGSYIVCVTDSMGCVACLSIYINDSNTIHVNTILADNLFLSFPNPATDHLAVELKTNTAKTEIKIFNTLGELEYTLTTTEDHIDIDVSNWIVGIHIVQITNGNNISRQKIIKQ